MITIIHSLHSASLAGISPCHGQGDRRGDRVAHGRVEYHTMSSLHVSTLNLLLSTHVVVHQYSVDSVRGSYLLQSNVRTGS